MEKDFEYLLTKHMWEDPGFSELAQRDPIQALKSIGVNVPPDVKIKIISQRKDTLYYTIPPAKNDNEADVKLDLNQMDLWSSADMFVWVASVYDKVELLSIRSSI